MWVESDVHNVFIKNNVNKTLSFVGILYDGFYLNAGVVSWTLAWSFVQIWHDMKTPHAILDSKILSVLDLDMSMESAH